MTHSSQPSGSDTPALPRRGLVFIIFDKRPFAKSLLKSYLFFVFVGYSALIGLANSLRAPGLDWWIGLWRPVVQFMRSIVPVFDNSAAIYIAKGYGYRIDTIHHLLAVFWLVAVVACIYLSIVLVRLTANEWRRFVEIVPKPDLLLMLFGGGLIWATAMYWAVVGIGFGSAQPLASFHLSNASLLVIGACFYCLVLFGTCVLVSVGALIVSALIQREA